MFKRLSVPILLFFTSIDASYLTDAHKALKEENLKSAVKLYKLSARDGVDEANFQLGKIYYLKKYKKRDLDKAYEYFKKAADYEHEKAKYNLAVLYSQKKFKKYNPKLSYKLFHSLALQRYPKAQYRVGISLLDGLGVEKDYSLSKRWLEEAYFENNYSKASCALSYIYANGLGVIQNLGRARKLSEPYMKKYPLCKKIFNEFKLYKNKYKEDKGFKIGYYK